MQPYFCLVISSSYLTFKYITTSENDPFANLSLKEAAKNKRFSSLNSFISESNGKKMLAGFPCVNEVSDGDKHLHSDHLSSIIVACP